jgi:hypothetical protein
MLKKVWVFMISLVLVFGLVPRSYASGADDNHYTNKINIRYGIEAQKYIKDSQLDTMVESEQVVVFSEVECNTQVNSIKTKIYLEKWNNNRWNVVDSYEKSKSNTDTLSFSMTVSINSNSKYRIRAVHTVTHNGYTESSTNTSSTI